MTKTKKGVTAANISHPNSRKAAQLVKQIHRGTARKKSKMAHMIKQNTLGEKIIWFRDHLEPNITNCTREMVADLIAKYLQRFDEELEQIKLKHSIGKRKNNRQHASREDIIMLNQLQEHEWYRTCGIDMAPRSRTMQWSLLLGVSGQLDPAWYHDMCFHGDMVLGVLVGQSSSTMEIHHLYHRIKELPDLLNPVQLSLVQKWQGELRFLQNFKLRRFTQSFLRAENSFKNSRPASPENNVMATDPAEEDNQNEVNKDSHVSGRVVNEIKSAKLKANKSD